MPLLAELGTAVRLRRQEIGLSQQQLAALVELSRATINELETGRLQDLSSRRIERVANALGFAVGLVGMRSARDHSPLEAAARIASVAYTKQVPASVLAEALKTGTVPPEFLPHLRTVLDESPLGILADIAEELQQVHGVPRTDTWRHMRTLAGVLKCHRPLWQSGRT